MIEREFKLTRQETMNNQAMIAALVNEKKEFPVELATVIGNNMKVLTDVARETYDKHTKPSEKYKEYDLARNEISAKYCSKGQNGKLLLDSMPNGQQAYRFTKENRAAADKANTELIENSKEAMSDYEKMSADNDKINQEVVAVKFLLTDDPIAKEFPIGVKFYEIIKFLYHLIIDEDPATKQNYHHLAAPLKSQVEPVKVGIKDVELG